MEAILDIVSLAVPGLGAILTFILSVYLWCLPMNRIRTFEDNVGFGHLKGKRDMINRVRRNRKAGRIPPPFPNGWYAISESRDIKRGEVVPVSALGQNFAVFRGRDSGKVFVTHAYCPHLGADITAGGKINGDEIVCPFHKWSFDGQSGNCTKGPVSEKGLMVSKLRTWRTVEANGLVYVWYHVDDTDPMWEPVRIDEVTDGDWVYQGRSEYHVSCHIEDIPENGADPAHLDAIHSSTIFSGGEPTKLSEFLTQWTWHEWGIQWKPVLEDGDLDEDGIYKKHMAVVELKHDMTCMGKFNLFSLNVRGEQIGPSLVHLYFESFMGKGVMLQYTLPLEPMLQKVVHVFYTQRSWIRPYAKVVLWGESILFERDVTMWNSKTYIDRPIADKGDKLILKHRRWYSQFYSENSKSLRQINEESLEW